MIDEIQFDALDAQLGNIRRAINRVAAILEEIGKADAPIEPPPGTKIQTPEEYLADRGPAKFGGYLNIYNGAEPAYFPTKDLADRAACRPELDRIGDAIYVQEVEE